MATYFNGAPGIQADGMQTLYLMNPAYVSGGYSDHSSTAAHRTDMFFLNSPLNSQNAIPHHHRQQQQHFVLMGSKYLKAAQQLLGQAVSVGTGRSKSSMSAGGGKDVEGERGSSDGGGGAKKASDLSTAERQELQMKKDKLVNMLDEVEHRYRRYRQQMQVVVSAFEAAAGSGSAQAYTALAQRTISRQFRRLRDAISRQIRAAGRSLGEEDGKLPVGSRMRYVDRHLRQQRALQQLGMVQHDDWRPQRGLPERAVSVLRAWLFEHFLHPYPRDSDKHMLAKRTGLTRSQVSNWFINARVRLWKPMVEEMYLEETKQQEHNDGDINNGEASEQSASINAPTTEPLLPQQQMQPPIVHQNAMKFMDQGAYGLRRFDHDERLAPRLGGNGVSLTLGLPRRETISLSGSQQPSYLSNESISYFSLDGSSGHGNNPSASPAPNSYESVNIQSRQRFAAQLLPDFVA